MVARSLRKNKPTYYSGELYMENIILVNFIVFMVIGSVFVFIGLDLKKWYSWLIGLYGFLSGLGFGFISSGNSSGFNIELGLQVGLIMAFMSMYGGATIRHYRQRFGKEAARDWLARYGQNKNYTLLARIMRKLFEK